MRPLNVLLLICGLFGCWETAPSQAAHLTVSVEDDAEQPLAEVAVELDGKEAARTDQSGKATIQAPRSKPKVRVQARCPEAYREAAARIVNVSANGELALRLECRPRLRTLAVVVNAPRAEGLTMRADGEPIGRVGPDGVLHAVLKRAPDSDLRLTLDTGPAPQLRPQHPSEDVVVPDRDEIIVFNHPLVALQTTAPAVPAKKTKPLAVARAPEEARHVPYSIGKRW